MIESNEACATSMRHIRALAENLATALAAFETGSLEADLLAVKRALAKSTVPKGAIVEHALSVPADVFMDAIARLDDIAVAIRRLREDTRGRGGSALAKVDAAIAAGDEACAWNRIRDGVRVFTVGVAGLSVQIAKVRRTSDELQEYAVPTA